jgi:hypothetical protein
MTGDDLGIAHVPTPVETGDLVLLEHGEYRVLDVIPLKDEQSPLYAVVRAKAGTCTTTRYVLSAVSLERVIFAPGRVTFGRCPP